VRARDNTEQWRSLGQQRAEPTLPLQYSSAAPLQSFSVILRHARRLGGQGLPLLMGVTTMRKYSLTLLAAAAVALAASQTASAADLGPVGRAPPPAAPAFVPPPVLNWTGFYIVGNLGVAWTHADVTDNFGNSFSNSQQAVFTGGGQVGANYQWNWLVVGVEADFDWLANNHNSTNTFLVNGNALQLSFNDRWITTVTGRVGYAFNLFGANGWGWNPGNGGVWAADICCDDCENRKV
jgi:hypothetical protein